MALYHHLRDLFSFKPDLVLYDITSTYFEGAGPADFAKHGHSRDGKPHNVQSGESGTERRKRDGAEKAGRVRSGESGTGPKRRKRDGSEAEKAGRERRKRDGGSGESGTGPKRRKRDGSVIGNMGKQKSRLT